MTQGEVSIHVVYPASVAADFALECLTDEEKFRASRFHFSKDATHWAACRSSLRGILGLEIGLPSRDVPLVYSEFGKPLLAPPFDDVHFNLSHCADLALVAISRVGPVGIDLESLSRAPELLDCETSFCHPEEIRTLPQEPTSRGLRLLQIWTCKEAVLKAMGTGLSHPPEKVRMCFQSTSISAIYPDLPGIEHQVIHQLESSEFDRYRAVIAHPRAGGGIKLYSAQT